MSCSTPIYAYSPASPLQNFPENSRLWEIGSAFLSSALIEVATHPKPGLVTPFSNGAHRDMNLQTFMKSSAAIAPCFYECAQAGYQHEDALPDLLPKIRQIGQIYEDLLLKTTQGVNTQRGYLFSAGVLCAAAGFASHHTPSCTDEGLFMLATQICQGLCARELEQTRSQPPRTAGERLYQRYGTRGIRGEVENGFPSLSKFGLPAYRAALQNGACENTARIQTLITIMSVLEDTTILSRGNPKALHFVQQRAQKNLSLGGALTPQGMEDIHAFDAELIQKNLSPGGSADLLAVTIAVHTLTNPASEDRPGQARENKNKQTSNQLETIKS